MEQASGSIMTGIRVFSAHLPLTSLLLLWPSTAFQLFVYFQVNTGVSYFLDYVKDLYDVGLLCPDEPKLYAFAITTSYPIPYHLAVT